ncbi:MAG: porin [Thermoanaerobaculia bacterium]|nr:porin [Thermoanaerobaculia bacterium]
MRTFLRLFCGTLTLIAALAVSPARAEEEREREWVVKWSNGFKVEKGDEFQLKFGGRIQADFVFFSSDDVFDGRFGKDALDNGAYFRRARLFFEGTIYERVTFKAQYDFAGGDADFKDVYMGLLADWGELRVGHYKEYFSLEELTSSKYLAFLERPLPVVAFVPSRNTGVGAHGKRGDTLNWGVGVFYEADDFGRSVDGDRLNLTGRLAYRPIYEEKGKRLLHVGFNLTNKEVEDGGTLRFRSRPGLGTGPHPVETGGLPADGALISGLEVAGVQGRFWYAGEYVRADVDSPTLGDPSLDGAYVDAGWYLTRGDYRRFKTSSGTFDRQKPSDPWLRDGGRGAWEVALRFSTLDLDDGLVSGGQSDTILVALNWYPNPATRLMLNLVHADLDVFGEVDALLMRWQVDF